VRRLGGKWWQRLHRFVYLVAFIAAIHFFLQSKSDVTEPTVMAGLGAWLLFYRLRAWMLTGQERRPVAVSSLLALGAAVVTALGEALYYWLKMGVDPLLVLDTNLTLDAGLRPAMAVLAILAGVVIAATGRAAVQRRTAPKLRPAYSDAAAE
jgi:sulfoxide reductase heme-binding subunit YedZ